MNSINSNGSGALLNRLYKSFNKPEYIHPDPLEFARKFSSIKDREIAALLASALAYGRVSQILASAEKLFSLMGNAPHDFVKNNSFADMSAALNGFKHRFHTGDDIARLLSGVRSALDEYGSLEQCFLSGFNPGDKTVVSAQKNFAERICRFFSGGKSSLLPSPEAGSACKRFNLMLRWLVRKDDVDPGGWNSVPASALIVPLDTHMNRLAHELKLTSRNAADLKTALEITAAFAETAPEDPVKFDFALTRFGINPEFPKTVADQ